MKGLSFSPNLVYGGKLITMGVNCKVCTNCSGEKMNGEKMSGSLSIPNILNIIFGVFGMF